MAKKPTFIRTSISLSADLKRRMDKCTESVNWSALACRAFEEKLAEIASKKKEKAMDEVISRLRATKIKENDMAFAAGKTAGEEWAKNSAEASELERLARAWQGAKSRGHEELLLQTNEGDAYSAAECLVFIIQPESDHQRDIARDFWQCICGDDSEECYNPSFLEGFISGALGVWEAVKDAVGE